MGHARLQFKPAQLQARAARRKTATRRPLKPSNTRLRLYGLNQRQGPGEYDGPPMSVKAAEAWDIFENHGKVGSSAGTLDPNGDLLRICTHPASGSLLAAVATPKHAAGDQFTWKETTLAEHIGDGRVRVDYWADVNASRIVEPTDEELATVIQHNKNAPGTPINARYMPQWRARFVDTIKAVRFSRLQQMDQEDCAAEGFDWSTAHIQTARMWWQAIWCDMYGPEAYNANPWVVVYELELSS